MSKIRIKLDIGSIFIQRIKDIYRSPLASGLRNQLNISFSGILDSPLLIIGTVEAVLLNIRASYITILCVQIFSRTLLANIIDSSCCDRSTMLVCLNAHGNRLALLIVLEITSLTLGTLCIQRHSLLVIVNVICSAVHCSHSADLVLAVMLEGIVFSCLFGCV